MASDGLPKNLEPLAAGDPASVGPYALAGRLGSGGMGTVYLGRSPDRESLVAIKVIRPELAFDEATRARFRDEMENARRVASFCTAKILDHGTFENRPYMVTEYISGTALAEHVAEHGPLDSSTLHGFALGVAAALAAIHGAGLVHRDLKPANVLLSLSGPRVIDFGIARALNTRTNHTQTGIVMGSPGWMAPEQLLEETVTTKADIFAWGCLVAFAGSGEHPFGNGDAMTLGKRVLFAEPHLRALDSPLDRLVRAALSKEAERRPGAQDLLLELAGGGGEAGDPNAMVSHALHQSWRPNLPPGPPPRGAGGYPGPGHPPQHYPGPPTPQNAPPPPGPPAAPPSGQAHAAAGAGASPRGTGQFPVVAPHQSEGVPQAGSSQTGTHQHPGRPYVPPVPPPQHTPDDPERRRIGWLAAAAATGVVLLLAVFVLLTWLGASGRLALPWQDQSSPQDQGAPSGDEDPGQEPTEDEDMAGDSEDLPDGVIGIESDERVEFTVYQPECGIASHGAITAEGASYCRFPVEAMNMSPQPVVLDHEWQELRDETSESLPAQRPAQEERRDSLWQEIPDGERAQGTVVFLVEDGRSVDELILRGGETGEGARIPVPPGTASPSN